MKALISAIMLVLFSSAAHASTPTHHQAHHKHFVRHHKNPTRFAAIKHHYKHFAHHKRRAAPVAVAAVAATDEGGPIGSAAGKYLGENPTGWSNNWCGHFMGMIARSLGLPTPSNPNLAANWEKVGEPASPQAGVIGVFRSGHHVGVVLLVKGTMVLVRSGNHGHRVADGWYPIRGAVFRSLT